MLTPGIVCVPYEDDSSRSVALASETTHGRGVNSRFSWPPDARSDAADAIMQLAWYGTVPTSTANTFTMAVGKVGHTMLHKGSVAIPGIADTILTVFGTRVRRSVQG